MTFLITGAAGFLGSNLSSYLLTRGHTVIGVDNFRTSSNQNISELCKQPQFVFYEQDITKPLEKSLPDLQWVLHFASPASPQDYLQYPIETMMAGSYGTHNCLELVLRHKASFFLASTSEVYGDPLVHPQVEEYWGSVNCVGPRAVYDEAKRYAESLTYAYCRKYNVPVRVARIFNTYGPRMRVEDGRVVSNFVCQALRGEDITIYGEGTQTRSFCYVNDLVEGIYRLILSSYTLPVNLGNPAEFTVNELAKRILSRVGSRSKIVYKTLPEDDPKQRMPDISKARKLFDWQPKITLDEGLGFTIQYFREVLKIG